MPVNFRGVTLDASTRDKFLLAELWIRHDLKDPSFTLSFPQGSYSTSVAASGGTHSGGGVADVHCAGLPDSTKVIMMHYFRACVGFGWHRPYNWDGAGGGEHMHIGEIGNPNMSSALKSQVAQWYAEDNGLANHAHDSESIDAKAGRPFRIKTPPGVVSAPSTSSEDDVLVIIKYPRKTAGKTYKWAGDFLLSGGRLVHLTSPADEAAFVKAGVPVVNVSYDQYVALGGK